MRPLTLNDIWTYADDQESSTLSRPPGPARGKAVEAMNCMGYRGGQSGAMGVIPGGPLGKAKYALAMGDADEAERLCRKQLERAPDNAAARVLLAQVLLQTGRAGEAVTEARRV